MMVKMKISFLWFLLFSFTGCISLSATGNYGLSKGHWESGLAQSPTGNMSETEYGFSPSIQITYNKWRFKPTFEFNALDLDFNFNTWQARQNFDVETKSYLCGVTREFDFLSCYALVGYTDYKVIGSMTEYVPYRFHCWDAKLADDTCLTFKGGIYKTFDLPWFGLKLGPGVSLQYFDLKDPLYSYCRKIGMQTWYPSVGLRVQW